MAGASDLTGAAEKRINDVKKQHVREDGEARDKGLLILLGSFEGRRFLWMLLEECRCFQQPFRGKAAQTAFACGEMNVGLRLLDQLMRVAPEALSKMMKENQDVRERRAAEIRRALRSAEGAGDAEGGAG